MFYQLAPYFELNGNRYEFKRTRWLIAEYRRLNEENPLSDEDKANAITASNLVADVKKFTSVVASISKLKEPKPSKWEGKLRPLIQSIRNYGEFLETLDSAESTLAKIAKLKEPKPCEWTDRELSTLIRSLRNYHSAVITVSDCRDYLDDAYASLEGVACPVCGRPLSRDTCLL